MDSGVARRPIVDEKAYIHELRNRLDPTASSLQMILDRVRANPRRTARDVRLRFKDIDRRLADVETYVTSSNNRLAREIEELR